MVTIRGKLWLAPSDNGQTATVCSFFVFVSAIVGDVSIPEGFVTDFNSTPRLVWRLFAKWEYPLAGVVHDRLYQLGASDRGRITRSAADAVHAEILGGLGAPSWKVRGARLGLLAGGWVAWNRYRAQEQVAAS